MGFHCFVLPLRFNVDFRPGIKVSFVSLSILSLIFSCGKLQYLINISNIIE